MYSKMMACWAAYSKNEFTRNKSSSGGVFYEIAKRTLENQGVVYGVAMSDGSKTSEYVRITHLDELSPVLGSKYLQATIGDTFSRVEHDLINGLYVLFSGTGCIINGLKLYLKHDYKNLLCVDVICHGVSSPLLWNKYISNIERKTKSRINHVEFRNKINGWENSCVSWTDELGRQTITPLYASSYMQWFLNNLSLRPSCYACRAKKNHFADISLGDFWGIDKVVSGMNDDKGVSLVIVRTVVGEQVFDSIIPNLHLKEVSIEDAIRENPMEYESASKPKNRDKFFSDLQNMTIPRLERKYKTTGFIYQLRKSLSWLVHKKPTL